MAEAGWIQPRSFSSQVKETWEESVIISVNAKKGNHFQLHRSENVRMMLEEDQKANDG